MHLTMPKDQRSYKNNNTINSRSSRSRSNSLPGWTKAQSSCCGNGGCGCGKGSISKNRKMSFVDTSEAGIAVGADQFCGIKNACCWWEPDREDASDTVDFTLETSLHGLKYICQPRRHLCERVFWLIAFVIGMIMAGWLISDVWLTYISSPLIVTFQPFETTIDKIPFPAITICNMNKVLKSKAEEYISNAQGSDLDEKTLEARKNVYYLDHVCSSSKSFSQKFNFSSKRGVVDPSILKRSRVEDGDDEQRDVARFLQMASQPCSEMLLLCAWQDVIYNCSDIFKPIETDFGKCCTFNMMPHMLLYKNWNDKRYNPDEVTEWAKWKIEEKGLLMNDEVFPRRQKRAGKSSGLSVLLSPDLEEYFCTSSDSHGFQVVKHLPIDVPKAVDFGIAIRPNSEVFMAIRPEITMAEQDIKNFNLEKRNCYFHGEYHLAYYKHYTSSNCYDECLANQTYEICHCVSYYMPRDDTRDLCGASSFGCAEDLRKSTLQTGIKSRCDFCLPACTELEYFSETTFTPIQQGDIWVDDKNLTQHWYVGLDDKPHNGTGRVKKNVSIVHIYFSSDSTYARVRKELYGITDLIANTGGLMGLCLGFSGLSLIELIYFYTLRAWCRTRRRRSMWSIAALKFHRMWMKSRNRNASNIYATSSAFNEDCELQSRPSNDSTNIAIECSLKRQLALKMKEDQLLPRYEECNSYSRNDSCGNYGKPYVFVPDNSKPCYRRYSGCECRIGDTSY